MFSYFTFLLSAAVLLLMPGPTNALLMASGMIRGWRASFSLIFPVLLAFCLVIAPLLLLNELAASARDWVGLIMRIAAILLLLFLAVRMWRTKASAGGRPDIAPGRGSLFLATLFNPKGLIFGLVIFPPIDGAGDLAIKTALFLLIGSCSSLVWILAGAGMSRSGSRLDPVWVGRGFSLVLVAFAVYIAATIAGLIGAPGA